MVRTSSTAAPLPHHVLLEEARRAQRLHFILPAGMLARAALESHLKLLCDWYGRSGGKKYPRIREFTSSLYQARVIDRESKKRIRALAEIGNRAAHNGGVEWWEVAELIDGTADVLERFPLTPQQLASLALFGSGGAVESRDDQGDDDDDEGDAWKEGVV